MATILLPDTVDNGPLLPDLINEGLAANDRVKYYLTLLQTANAHALRPFDAVLDLRNARESSGVRDEALDEVVMASRRIADGVVRIPGACRLRQLLFDDVRRMLAPLRATVSADAERQQQCEAFSRRIAEQSTASAPWADDQVEARAIDAFTSPGDETHDTVHRIVMELHRELNRLVANVALESIDGARVTGMTPADRPLVAAFMKGVNLTASLKFDHPGLGTTAARYGGLLSIQNDLGTTEGHVVVIRIDGLTATAIYSDVHRKRVHFFRDLLQPYAVEWEAGAVAAGEQNEMIVGRFTADSTAALEQFLTFVGSRLVFLIDWNRARKQLLRFVGKADAIAVLKWAADNNVGHRAFLQTGGARLIYKAFERVAPARTRYGARLDELVGQESAVAFLKAVLRIASTALQGGHSVRLVQDQVEAELLSHLEGSERKTLDAAADHAMLVSALAERVRTTLGRASASLSRDDIAKAAGLAKTWESRADEIVRDSNRRLDRRDGGGRMLRHLLGLADNAADALEETAFLLTLVPEHAGQDRFAALRGLADLVSDAAKEYVRSLEDVRDLSRSHTSSDVEHVLVGVDRIAELEHASDAAERAVKTKLVAICTDFRELQILSDAARELEGAADALARCALTIRDYALSPEGRRS